MAVAYLIIFGWLYSFIRNLIRHKNFVVRRRKNELYIDSGIITNRSYSIRLDEINYIDIRQSLVTKLLGLYSVFVNAVGYGKEKDDISAMIPLRILGSGCNGICIFCCRNLPHPPGK